MTSNTFYTFSQKRLKSKLVRKFKKKYHISKKPVSHYKMIVDAYFMHFVKKKKEKKKGEIESYKNMVLEMCLAIGSSIKYKFHLKVSL